MFANASSGRWAELQGHVDGLAESLQNLIRGRAVDLVDQASAAEEGIKETLHGQVILREVEQPCSSPAVLVPADTCSAQLADLDSKVLQMSGRLVQVEYRLEGRDLAAPDRGVPVPGVQADEAGQVDFLRESEDFKDEDMSILEDQVSDMGRRFEQMQRHLEELVTDQSMQNLGERTQRLYSKASAEWSEMTLGKDWLREPFSLCPWTAEELSAVSEDLTRLWIRVEEHEQSLMPLAEAFRHQEPDVDRGTATQGLHAHESDAAQSRALTLTWRPVPGGSELKRLMAEAGFTIGQRVYVSSRSGVVRFCGETEFAGGTWVGIELEEPVGRSSVHANDGTVKDVSYFSCPANHGIFVRPTQVATSPMAKAPGITPGSPTSPAAKSSRSSGSSPFGVAKAKAEGSPKAKAATPKAPAAWSRQRACQVETDFAEHPRSQRQSPRLNPLQQNQKQSRRHSQRQRNPKQSQKQSRR
eukprot:g29251.t3